MSMLTQRRDLVVRAGRVYRAGGAAAVLRSFVQVLKARWAFRGADMAPSVRLRGGARVNNHGTMRVGARVRLDGTVLPTHFTCARGATLSIGEGTFINYGCNIGATRQIEIGRNCDIGQLTLIMDSDWHSAQDHRSQSKPVPVVIEDDVWIGARVTILKGSHIGRGAVIGAHAVVRGYIPPRTLAGGVPARVIRDLDGGADDGPQRGANDDPGVPVSAGEPSEEPARP